MRAHGYHEGSSWAHGYHEGAYIRKAVRRRLEDAMLLDLKIEENVLSQERQVGAGSWKLQENRCFARLS